ncbi:MAG TPA: 16S rRNA (guanine(527)-N(7))-methyltransferase RsmG [Candidatus Sulfotelmatobacter sp.]|nr:16S rRNA (guanine(527)-N(7))-methyltransferase RsmG [Candidatus Sulfotelmatobacter sp.]
MDHSRIAALLAEFVGRLEESNPPAGVLLANISTYIDILLRWNARVNLTAIREPEEIVTRHFGESLFAARYLFPRASLLKEPAMLAPGPESASARASSGHGDSETAVLREALADETAPLSQESASGRAALQGRVIAGKENGALAPVAAVDVGSGAGFPGIPLKLWAPEISLTLVESNHKKAVFLREVARALTLTDINIQTARAETIPAGTFDLVTLRAVERFDRVLPAAAALLKPQGRLALLIGATQLSKARSILPNHEFLPLIPIPLSTARVLSVSYPSVMREYLSDKQVE